MRLGERCPYKTPCGFCSRNSVECTHSTIKRVPVHMDNVAISKAALEGGGVDE